MASSSPWWRCCLTTLSPGKLTDMSTLAITCLPRLSSMLGWSWLVWSLSLAQSALGLAATVSIVVALKWITPTKNKVLRSFQVVGSYIIQVIPGNI